ncbi:type 1 glutamine amidotransferase domain-containing protein [uncultured Croceitalea sp.]|uniref:type 1 glutamine amidotransferase domain-containing protein n=1 Tax=uncultured Croceitalea sp. TaxID=1798908 RepID=UPI0033060092
MRTIFLLYLVLFLVGCTEKTSQLTSKETTSNPKFTEANRKYKVLFVTSNAKYYGDSDIETTNNFPEIVYAYHEFVKAAVDIDFVSPKGGQVPIGYIHSSDSILQQYLLDDILSQKLKNTFSPDEIETNNYVAIYYVGGGSAMFGVPENKQIQKIARIILEKEGGILFAICHGTAGITTIKTKNSDFAISNHKITGFPNSFEDTSATYYKEFPFAIDDAVTESGGSFKYSDEGWDGYVVVDRNIITGQNPTSASLVAKEIIEKIK